VDLACPNMLEQPVLPLPERAATTGMAVQPKSRHGGCTGSTVMSPASKAGDIAVRVSVTVSTQLTRLSSQPVAIALHPRPTESPAARTSQSALPCDTGSGWERVPVIRRSADQSGR
jgi:hypothetical protein